MHILRCTLLLTLLGISLAQAGPSKENLLGYLAEQITRSPDSTTPYLRRAHTLAEIGMWDAAYSDLDQIDKLGDHTTAALVRGDFLSRQGKLAAALAELDKAIRLQPNNLRAYLLRAEVLLALGEKKKALADYKKLFSLQPEIESGFYREAALLTEDIEGPRAALALLDQRMETLGPIPQLQNLAIAIEQRRKNYQAAILRMKSFSPLMRSSPFWHSQLAHLELLNGNPTSTRHHLEIAENLLSGRRQTQVSRQLQNELLALREKLKAN